MLWGSVPETKRAVDQELIQPTALEAGDKLRSNPTAVYKYLPPWPIFLKYVSDAFTAHLVALKTALSGKINIKSARISTVNDKGAVQ